MAIKRIWGTLDPFVEDGPILGRKMANAGFLHALLAADPFDEYHFFLADEAGAATLRQTLAGTFPDLERRGAFRTPPRADLPAELGRQAYHCFHLSDFVSRHPALSLIRNTYSPRLFPVTSVTHSLSYKQYMGAFLEHLWPGASSRDAIVVTSRCAGDVIRNAFSALRQGYGLGPHEPSLPCIPLGVDAAQTPSLADITAVRARLGLREGEVLFLCLARLSAQSKMDFLPIFAACKRMEKQGVAPHGYRLALAGWVEEDDPLPGALRSLANGLGIPFSVVERPSSGERDALYHLADVFLSPSDNVQETFGLTVAEAAAAGVPVIASDFDGYRDTVIHGETGYLVPTIGFGNSAETDVLASIWMDNQYHFKLAQQTVVDVPVLAGHMVRLALDHDLRRTMGRAAREHAERNFAWPVVIARYCALWDGLWTKEVDAEEEQRLRRATHPLGMDFAGLFRGHFSAALDNAEAANLVVQLTPLGQAFYRGVFPTLPYTGLDLMLDRDLLHRLLFLARKPLAVDALLAELTRQLAAASDAPPARFMEERAAFVVLWALKQDLVERVTA